MKKLLIALMIFGIQLFVTGCDMLTDGTTSPVDMAKKTPCMEEVKNGNARTQSWTPGITTDLTVKVNGENVKIADVTVYTICGGCWVYVTNVASCWELKDIRIWIGKNISSLKSINADPSQFPDLEIHSVEVGSNYIVFPYETDWYCGDMLNYAVWANAKDTCNEDCGQEIPVNAVIGNWALTSENGNNRGSVNVLVNNGNLIVKYNLISGWNIQDAHLEIEKSISSVPVNGGNHLPNVSLFDYNHTSAYYNSTTKTFTIPLSVLNNRLHYVCGQDWLYTLVHATIKKNHTTESIWGGEIDWNFGCVYPVKYLKFKMPCPTYTSCEYDAWGKGTDDQEFRDINVQKFGWYFQCPIVCD